MSLFIDDVSDYVENPKYRQKIYGCNKQLQQGTKIQGQYKKSNAFLYSGNQQVELKTQQHLHQLHQNENYMKKVIKH